VFVGRQADGNRADLEVLVTPIRETSWLERPVISCPFQITLPRCGRSTPEIVFSIVVLPAPLGPITPVTPAFSTLKLTLERAIARP
jgi:hypothetical protein